MKMQSMKVAFCGILLSLVPVARAQQSQAITSDPPLTARVADLAAPEDPPTASADSDTTTAASRDPLLDRTHQWLYDTVWHTAMRIDRWFGATEDETPYREASGSIAPALLWDEFDGFQSRLRFRADLPLPQLDDRFHAFIGRVNREEYVTERRVQSGAFPSQYGPLEDDQTLFGISYREPREGGRFTADAGVRIRLPMDPYLKGSYVFEHGGSRRTRFSLRETAFWQNSEQLGLTSRADIERLLDERSLLRWTISGTLSQRTQGVRGYTALTYLHGFPNRRAFAAELFSSAESDAPVPVGDYGAKLAFRRSISRDWLILETRTSLTWPREHMDQPRAPSWGVGVGFEMLFGTEEFLARPVTF